MSEQPDRSRNNITYGSLAEGIMHGPYADIPADLLAHYLTEPERYGAHPGMSIEQFIIDKQSEWQYDQHAEQIDIASRERRITPEHAMHMLDNPWGLRKWFIGKRNPTDLP